MKKYLLLGFLILVAAVGLIIHFSGSPHALANAPELLTTAPTGKQLWTCGMHPQVIQDHPGICPICHMRLTPLKTDANDGDVVANTGPQKPLWWDPMLGPSSISDKPGKSAMGMDLVPYNPPQTAGPAVRIDPAIVQNMGVRTAEVTRGPLNKTVRTVGVIESPESGLYDITLRVNGWIEKLYADQEGMHVHKGDPLFEVYSPDLQIAEEELITSVHSLQSLDPSASDQTRKDAQSLVDSTKRKLQLWDIADQDIDAIAKADKAPKTILFRSPAHGEVMDKMIVEGSYVQAGTKLMRIEDHSTMWLKLQVYEDQIPVVKLGQTVEATAESLPGETFRGPISFIYPHLDHMARTSIVRVTFNNPDLKLRPGMYATASIITEPVPDAIQVPREAVIDTGTKQIAFVAASEGHFTPRNVRMGIVGDDDMVQILEGLSAGETVVTSGQFLLDVESRTTEAINKLRGSSPISNPVPMEATKPIPMEVPKPTTIETATPMRLETPATQAARRTETLVVAHCPMKNADWIQIGEDITNPYFGKSMINCGSVNKKISSSTNTDLAAVTDLYLEVQKSLAADSLNTDQITKLKSQTDKLAGDLYANLRKAVDDLAAAKDIDSARVAFKSVSAELIQAVDKNTK